MRVVKKMKSEIFHLVC